MFKRGALSLAIATAAFTLAGWHGGVDDTGGGARWWGGGDDSGSGSGSGSGSLSSDAERRPSWTLASTTTPLRFAPRRCASSASCRRFSRSRTSRTPPTRRLHTRPRSPRCSADARFQRQALGFWRDTFKMGGAADLDTAPAFAAQLSTTNGSSDALFTATTGNCPTFERDDRHVHRRPNCANNGPARPACSRTRA